MAIKVDRPMDQFGEGIVVYVAKSIDEINKARAGFVEAGIDVLLPEAAIEALFAAGKESLPIRVKPEDFKAASNVIDELFPPPELVLPPLEDEVPADAPVREQAASGEGPSGPAMERLPAASAHDGPTRKAPPKLAKMKSSIAKVMFIAVISIFVPVLGFLGAGFAIYASIWALKTLDTVVGGEDAQGLAKASIGVSVFALLANVGGTVYAAWIKGWLG